MAGVCPKTGDDPNFEVGVTAMGPNTGISSRVGFLLSHWSCCDHARAKRQLGQDGLHCTMPSAACSLPFQRAPDASCMLALTRELSHPSMSLLNEFRE